MIESTSSNNKQIAFFVPGVPQGKARARSSRKTGKHYTPRKTKIYERLIAITAKLAMRSREPVCEPTSLTLVMVFPIPKSWPLWKQEAARVGSLLPTTKPDADNVEKAIKDGCNGIVWRDDSYVTWCLKRKIYVNDDMPVPGVYVTAFALNAISAQETAKPAA